MAAKYETKKTLQNQSHLKVPFFDVDSMNIVWHGHYAKYFELARCDLLEQIGYSYEAMALSGFQFPIVDLHIKYIQPLVFNQEIIIHSSLVEWEYRLKVSYVIYDAKSEKKICSGHTIQAAVDIDTKKLRLQCPKVLQDLVYERLANA